MRLPASFAVVRWIRTLKLSLVLVPLVAILTLLLPPRAMAQAPACGPNGCTVNRSFYATVPTTTVTLPGATVPAGAYVGGYYAGYQSAACQAGYSASYSASTSAAPCSSASSYGYSTTYATSTAYGSGGAVYGVSGGRRRFGGGLRFGGGGFRVGGGPLRSVLGSLFRCGG